MRLLIVEDDRDIVKALTALFEHNNYSVDAVYNGNDGYDYAVGGSYDGIVMDIMMPGMDGIAATAELRKLSNVPIIFLTAKSEDTDKILGLNMGADDYITKPFNPLEVIARVRSHLRRYTQLGGQISAPHLFTVGPIVLDDGAKTVTVDGEPVNLTPLEFQILRLLMSRPGQVFSMVQIYEQVWKDVALGSENTVAVHIRHLREKIEIDPAHPRYLKVVWGLGYKMEQG